MILNEKYKNYKYNMILNEKYKNLDTLDLKNDLLIILLNNIMLIKL
jgi:hypothetical protein